MPRGRKKRDAGQEESPQQKTVEVPALLWKRIVAFILDMAIVYAITFLAIGDQLGAALPEASSFAESYALLAESSTFVNLLSIVFSILLLSYFLLLERRFGQSVGKMVMKLHVYAEGKQISFWQHLGRLMFLIPVFPLTLLWVADPIAMFFTKNNRRLCEIVSKTRVVEYQELAAATQEGIPQ